MVQVFPALEIPSFGFLYIAVALNHIVGLELAAQENVLLVNEAVAHITERPENSPCLCSKSEVSSEYASGSSIGDKRRTRRRIW